MSFEFLQGLEFGKDFGVRYYMLGTQIDKLEEECRKLRLVYLAAQARGLYTQYNAYWCDLEDILRDGQKSIEKGWTVQDFSSRVNDIFQELKDIKSDCIRLQNKVAETKSNRRKRKCKSSPIEVGEPSTPGSPSPSHDTVE